MRQLKCFSPVLVLFLFINSNVSKIENNGKTQVKIATWNNGSFDYYLPSGIKPQIEQIFLDSLNIAGAIDSVKISDPDPHNPASLPYLEFFISNHGLKTFFVHRIVKQLNGVTNLWDYYMTTDLDEEDEAVGARVVKCSSVENCNGCRRVRTGFLGLGGVVECPCTNNGELYCDFESTSGGFPWGPVLGFLGAVIAAIIAS